MTKILKKLFVTFMVSAILCASIIDTDPTTHGDGNYPISLYNDLDDMDSPNVL